MKPKKGAYIRQLKAHFLFALPQLSYSVSLHLSCMCVCVFYFLFFITKVRAQTSPYRSRFKNICTQFRKMKNSASKFKHNKKQSLPPRRGLIKIKILNDLYRSIASVADGFLRKSPENGGRLSTASPTSAATPSGYSSDGS